jgi:hypothetical protein
VVIVTIWIGCSNKDQNTEIPFTRYGGYFVKNTFPVDSIGNFLILNDTASFYVVFGMADIHDSTTEHLNSSYFNDQFVIAVIKKNFDLNGYSLEIKKISRNDETIRVDYTYDFEKYLGYSVRVPSIVMIKKQSWDKVIFYENDKFIKQINEPFH